MALSGGHTGSKVGGFSTRFEWSARQNATDIANNRSYVTIKQYLIIDSAWSVASGASKSGNIKLDGSNISFTKIMGTLYSGKYLIATKSKYVNHEDDGSKQFDLSGWFDFNINIRGYGWVGRLNIANKKYTLNTIPRASSITKYERNDGVYSFYVEDKIAWAIDSASNEFTHQLRLYRNNGTLATRNIAKGVKSGIIELTSSERNLFYGWAESWKKAEIVMEIKTFNNGVQIGNTKRFDGQRLMYVNPSIASPDLGSLSYKDVDAKVQSLIGNNQYLVQSKSDLEVKISQVTAKLSSKIKRVSVSVGNSTKTKTFNSTTTGVQTFLFKDLNVNKSVYAKISVTDSRGFTSSKDIQVLVYPYEKPKFVMFSVDRENGFEDLSFLNFKVKYSDIIKSTLSFEYASKSKYDSNYSALDSVLVDYVEESNESFGVLQDESVGEYSNNGEFDFKLVVKDHFGEYIRTFSLGKASGLAEISSDGLEFKETIGFGTKPTNDSYNVQVGTGGIQSDGKIIDKNGNEVFGVPMMVSGGNLHDIFNNMKDGTMQGIYSYNVTTANNWPETVSNNNTAFLIKMAKNYGMAFSVCGSNRYMARITSTFISWNKIN